MGVHAAIAVYVQVLAVLLPPVVTVLAAWVGRAVVEHLRSTRARAVADDLVRWAEQTIPSGSERYARVAELLSRQFPALRAQDVSVLIESAVQGLAQGLAGAGDARSALGDREAVARVATAAAAAASAAVTAVSPTGGAPAAVGEERGAN